MIEPMPEKKSLVPHGFAGFYDFMDFDSFPVIM